MALHYLTASPREIHWHMIRAAFSSVANIAIIPLQDLLGVGSTARMNRPGKGRHNWEWRLTPGQLTRQMAHRLRQLTDIYGRMTNA
jgi:4-alpha-glucanotransferase